MTNDEMMQTLTDFARRIEFLGQDFARLVEDFGAYEDEAACAWCGKKGGEEERRQCEHCRSQFCPKCWEEAVAIADAQKKREMAP
jgi:hypothetical protein